MLTADRLRQCLTYDPEVGVFYRNGVRAGGVNVHGYVVVSVDARQQYAHRLAVLYVTGAWPTGQVDHIDGVRSNNRYANLRDVTLQMNRQNQRRPHRDGSTGLLGVTFIPRRGKFQAQIYVNGTRPNLGYFNSAEEAHAAYVSAKRKLHAGNTI